MISVDKLVLSAQAIETYLYCPRRFEQRYLERIPALDLDIRNNPAIRRGSIFHQLVLWDGLGMDVSDIVEVEDDPGLRVQWRTFLSARSSLLPAGADIRYEPQFTIRVSGLRVIARIDAVVIHPGGNITIYDWKTSTRQDRNRLVKSPQSRIYPLAVWESLRRDPALNLTDPEQIQMVYWFPAEPDSPLTIACSSESLSEDRDWLQAITREINEAVEFPLTPDRRRCRSCGYATNCGVVPRSGVTVSLSEDDGLAFADLGGEEPRTPIVGR